MASEATEGQHGWAGRGGWRIAVTAVALAAALALIVSLPGQAATEEAKLVPEEPSEDDSFGQTVALDGDTALVGAPADDHGGDEHDDYGAVYVFERSDGTWSQQVRLTRDEAEPGDEFGASVALEGSTAVVGAPGDDSPGAGTDFGALYVYDGSEGDWTLEAQVTPDSQAFAGELLGTSVDLDGDTMVAGAPARLEADAVVYVFERTDGEWSEEARFEKPQGRNAGSSVAVDGDTALAGQPTAGRGGFGNAEDSGNVLVFTRDDDGWTEDEVLTLADERDYQDNFGRSLALDDQTALIGAPGKSYEGDLNSHGAAYAFVDEGDGWTRQANLTPSDLGDDHRYGGGVALDGSTGLVGTDDGVAYEHTRSGDAWEAAGSFGAADVEEDFDAAALDGETALLGASEAEDDQGAAYLFSLTDGGSGDGDTTGAADSTASADGTEEAPGFELAALLAATASALVLARRA